MLKIIFIFTVSALLAAAAMDEQEARFGKLPAGDRIHPEHVIPGMAMALGRTNPLGFAERVSEENGPGYDKAMRVVTRRMAEHPWSFQANAKCRKGVRRGDVLLAVFWARAAGASQEAKASFIYDQSDPPNEKSVNFHFECQRQWQRFFVPFMATVASKPGEAMLRFYAGSGPQVIEIGGLEVFSYGRAVALAEMPHTPITYKGRGESEGWRKEAAERIKKNRKAPIFITVRNAKGKVVPWSTIRIRQTRHAYRFGSELDVDAILDKGRDEDAYRAVLEGLFNVGLLDISHDLKRASMAAEWLKSRGLSLLGRISSDVKKCEESALALRECGADLLLENGGKDFSSRAIQAARGIAPGGRIFIHHPRLFSSDEPGDFLLDEYVAEIDAALDAKAPIKGISFGGIQGQHLMPPVRILETLDRLAGFRLPVEVSGFGVNVWDEQAAVDYMRDLMTAVFSHPASTGVSILGFWEKQQVVPNSAHWSNEWKALKAGEVWHDLVYKKWWTDSRVETNGKGVAKIHGFIGDYVVEVGSGEKMKSVAFKLAKSGEWRTVTMP